MKISEINNGNMNKIYILEIDKHKYIIRTSNFDNEFECKVLDLLSMYDYNCPKIITNFEINKKYIMLYEYIEGDNPTNFNNDFYITLAKLLKKLHSVNNDFTNEDYSLNEESQQRLYNYYNKALKSKYLINESQFLTEKYNDISTLDLNIFDKCIIHSDLKKENMIQNNKELYLIDFGNCYVGSRLIDINRVIMWFFIQNNNYDYDQIELFINSYFDNNGLTDIEKENIDCLLNYCLLYNLLKDVALNEDGILKTEYIENNSMNWLKALKDKEKILKIGGLIKNA